MIAAPAFSPHVSFSMGRFFVFRIVVCIVVNNRRGDRTRAGVRNQSRLESSAKVCTVSESNPKRESFSAFLWQAR